MKKRGIYRTITGRALDLGQLSIGDAEFLATIVKKYRKNPDWVEFSNWWLTKFRGAKVEATSLVYRVCQDLEARLGIFQNKTELPDYRDYLADLIRDRYESRYKFCQETGIDQARLSRIFTGHVNLTIGTLQKILEQLDVTLVLQPKEDLRASANPKEVADELELALIREGRQQAA